MWWNYLLGWDGYKVVRSSILEKKDLDLCPPQREDDTTYHEELVLCFCA